MKNLLMGLGLCLVVACGSLTCGEKAVGNAKAYILAEMPNLTDVQKMDIEDAVPMVMEVEIQAKNNSSEIPADALVQKCVVVNPSFLNKSIVVFGVCNKTTKNWDVIRAFLADKQYGAEDSFSVPVSDEELAVIVEKITPPVVEVEEVVEEVVEEEVIEETETPVETPLENINTEDITIVVE